MFLILMLVAGQVLVILEVSGDQQNRENRNTYVRQLILDAYNQEEVEALTEFIIDSVSFHNFLKKNTHESSTWTNIRTGSFKTFQESVFAYCKGLIELNRIPHLILAINAFIDYWPNREISSERDTRELKQPSKYTKEGFSKPDYHLKLMEFIRSPECRLSFVNDEFVGKIQSNGMTSKIKETIDNRISIAIQNNLNYKDERIFYDKLFRAIDDGDFQDALLAYDDWLEDTTLNYKEVVEYLSEVLKN
ncbi:uncharacterized protein LOC111064509 isoform X7 [Nilaparvata lugens]|uniref:uncharacterized protein LOC111064509 isoform X7 n=1 Tax=Nilaparvata lugens TaxID=108931 RepID=UPI00193D30EF|nr:uncharacterized protein LOC111064509 isoform X7 [Nilaparvata lugens]